MFLGLRRGEAHLLSLLRFTAFLVKSQKCFYGHRQGDPKICMESQRS